MNSRERVFAALRHQKPDRVPRFEIWIDALLAELGQTDTVAAYVNLGQDGVMMPTRQRPHSNAWKNGVDEWGRRWRQGMYAGGVVTTTADIERYSLSPTETASFFDSNHIGEIRRRYPDHPLIYGTHIGPLTAAYMAMGIEPFCYRLIDDPVFVQQLLANRTQWCIALYQRAIDLGAEILILGDDGAQRNGPLISPDMWRRFVLPYHRQIVEALDVPVIWHSDGNITSLLPMAIEAGYTGVHGLEPASGMDLAAIKQAFGNDLVLIGNIDVQVLCEYNLEAVRSEIDRCLKQGAAGGGYMLATCNSIFDGMNVAAVREMFRYGQACAGSVCT